MQSACFSATKAAKILGISVPTLKEMCASGQIAHFHTPGGHLRIPAGGLVSFNRRTAGVMMADRGDSPVLDSRIDDLNCESQQPGTKANTHREKLMKSQGAVIHTGEATGRELQHWKSPQEATMEWEAEQLELDQKFQPQETARAPRRDLDEARNRLEAFHRRWRSAISDMLPFWLSFEQHEEALNALYGVIARCSEHDEGRMRRVLRDAIARLLVPWEKEREVLTRREQLLQRALWTLSGWASAQEKTQAIAAVRKALADLPLMALEYEERSASEEAVRKVNEQIKVRLAAEDKERAENEAKERKARDERLRAFAEQQRKLRKDRLIQQGADRIWWCLQTLKNHERISEEDYEDIDQYSLKRAVDKILRSKLTGDETNQELEKLVDEIVVDELDID